MMHPDSLIAELDRLSQTLTSLTAYTQKEAELLATAQVDDLHRVLARKAELLQLVSIQREASRAVAAATLGVTLTEHARLGTLVEDIATSHTHDEQVHTDLTGVWQEIVCTIETLGTAQARSEQFARQGMAWIEDCLEHLTQPTTSSRSSTYTRQGKSSAGRTSFLQRQA